MPKSSTPSRSNRSTKNTPASAVTTTTTTRTSSKHSHRSGGGKKLRPWKRWNQLRFRSIDDDDDEDAMDSDRIIRASAGYGSLLPVDHATTLLPHNTPILPSSRSSSPLLRPLINPSLRSSLGRRQRKRRQVNHDDDDDSLVLLENGNTPSASSLPSQIVSRAEGWLRVIVIISLTYLAGVYIPTYGPAVRTMTHYTVTAWCTCLLLRGLIMACSPAPPRQPPLQQQQQQPQQQQQHTKKRQRHDATPAATAAVVVPFGHPDGRDDDDDDKEEEYDDIGEDEEEDDQDDTKLYGGTLPEQRPLLVPTDDDEHLERLRDDESSPDVRTRTTRTSQMEENATDQPQQQQPPQPQLEQLPTCVHPSLEPFFVTDISSGQRVFPNTMNQPYAIQTDYFEGHMMVLIRTPNVDDPAAMNETPENEATSKYMANKQRRFEFQFQIKLKKLPTDRVYFACELTESFKLGMIQRAFVSAAMAFVKRTNQSFHYSMTGTAVSASDGKYEKPHMAFPVEQGMNRLVATPPGQPLPLLGKEIVEDDESLKRRKLSAGYPWNLQDTYTMSLWSAYVDFLDWRCMNLPGIRPFDLRNIIGRQPILLTLYEIPEGKDKHNRCDQIPIAEFEMCHANHIGVGPAAQRWLESHRETRLVNLSEEEKPKLVRTRSSSTDGSFFVNEIPEADEDADAAAELGEGIYVRSGDAISLRESRSEGTGGTLDDGSLFFVTNGGGFAVLQEQYSSTIIIEKAKMRSKREVANSWLIKNGDAVNFKLVSKGKRGERTTKYLSLHRRCFLKWIDAVPTKNGYFTIHTSENGLDLNASKRSLTSADTQSSYLTFGGSFFLKHKRWSKYLVGATRNGSAEYGGRMLVLHNPEEGGNEEDGFRSEDTLQDVETSVLAGKDGERWIRPLLLEAYDSAIVGGTTLQLNPAFVEPIAPFSAQPLRFSSEGNMMDAPAWLEVMNRTERVRQLVYAVRVTPPVPDEISAEFLEGENLLEARNEATISTQEAFMRLRTGRDLSNVIRAGLNWRHSSVSPRSRQRKGTTDGEVSVPSNSPASQILDNLDQISVQTGERSGGGGSLGIPDDVSSVGTDLLFELDLLDDEEEKNGPTEGLQPGRPNKGRKLIGRIAKTVKTKTASTGKKVVRQSVKVGKGTVNAGKAMISGRPKIPPSREPKPAKLRMRRKVESNLKVPVSNKAIKRVEKVESRLEPHLESSSVIAGELSASEESRCTVSNMLLRMSSVPPTSSAASEFNALLASQVEMRSELDSAFLQGGSVELGVVPISKSEERGAAVFDCVVARCLWESHWREEWCSVHEKCILFYAPLTREPCLEVSFEDIQGIRLVDSPKSPLPGVHILAVETTWLCHYFALGSPDTRESIRRKLENVIEKFRASENSQKSDMEEELSSARLWQSLQNALESGRASGRGKWADISSGQRRKSRFIMNNRRMLFDLESTTGDIETLVEDLLSTSLSFSLDSLQHHPEGLIKFLDSSSMLRGLALQELPKAAASTFCIFVNLYHCVLQHALLLTANGPLTKRSCEHFMRTSCYEIGNDVFSLAELNTCIIRGNLALPVGAKPPYIEAPRKSNSYRFFALQARGPNVNFLLSTGDLACPKGIPVLRADSLDEQLTVQTQIFLRNNVTVSIAKKQVFIPKVCEVYRNDFSSDASNSALACLRYCLRYLDEPVASKIQELLQDEVSVTIKYFTSPEQYHSMLGPIKSSI